MKTDIQATYDKFIIYVNHLIQNGLSAVGVSENWITYTKLIVLILLVAITCYILKIVVKKILFFIIVKIKNITGLSILQHVTRNKLVSYISLIVPYIIIKGAIPIVFWEFKIFINLVNKLADACFVFIVLHIILSVIKLFAYLLKEKPGFRHKPLRSYIQVIQIILYIIGVGIVFSIFTGHHVFKFFATLGAASAVMLLIFKDSILGFVSSIQISNNDIVRVGDWITISKFGTNGNVEEINLTTVKVRNFDKTITSIPTYALISDSFQNWRGMQESGGRRFNRSLMLKHASLKFLNEEELESYKKVRGLKDYIEAKQAIFQKFDSLIDISMPINKHYLTNCDLFIQYGTHYLRNHPRINNEMSLMVRQLALTNEGVPIEFYCFTDTVIWIEYELILSEIMNHMICAAPFFDLVVYESSSGSDDYNVFLQNKS